MKIKMSVMAFIIPIVIFGGIAATIAADVWTTTTSKIPIKYTEGENAGNYNPIDIRGSYTFADISDLFKIDAAVLFQAFGIAPETDPTSIKTKDLEGLYPEGSNIGNESVQVFVALYKNLPIVLDDVYLPKQAVTILIEVNKKLTQEQIDYITNHQFDGSLTSSSVETSKTETEVKTETDQLVSGSTTFQQVIDKGIKKEQIEMIVGSKLTLLNQTIKDYCIEKGLTFSEIKDKINELQ